MAPSQRPPPSASAQQKTATTMAPPQQSLPSAHPQRQTATAPVILRARTLFAYYCKKLRLPEKITTHAEALYRRAYAANGSLVKEMSKDGALLIACIFLSCREAGILQFFSGLVAKFDAPVKETLEAIWFLENFGDVKFKIVDEPITVSWEPAASAYIGSGEVKLTWAGGSVVFLAKQYHTGCSKLREMMPARVEETTKAEIDKAKAETEDVKVENEEAKDEVEDWEVIDWKNEQKAGGGKDREMKKVVESGGWTKALRRGLFG